MLRTTMDITYEELITAACSNGDLEKAVHEAELDHLAYGRVDFYLDLGPDHKSLASVQRAGRGWLYVTYCNTSVYLQLTNDGKIVCEHLHNKEDSVVVAALARVFVLANYAISNRKVVSVVRQQRNKVDVKVADSFDDLIVLDEAKPVVLRKKGASYKYMKANPNGKEAWKNLGLVPVKTTRRGHFRRYKNGKTVWIDESEVVIYKQPNNCLKKQVPTRTPAEFVL